MDHCRIWSIYNGIVECFPVGPFTDFLKEYTAGWTPLCSLEKIILLTQGT